MKNILLTGSGGFLGSHLKQYLLAKREITVLTPRSSELDLTDKKAVELYFAKNKIDFIIHSAATGVRITNDATIDEVAKPNLEMFKNLAGFATEKRPMIVFGSGAEYDKSKPIVNVKESDFGKTIPSDPYGYSKYLISKEIEKRENILNLRIFGIYGYGEDPSRVTSCMIQENANHQDICLNQNVRFSFIYIDDFCRIVDKFLEKFPNEKFINLAQPDSVEIKELAKIVNQIGKFNSKVVVKKEGLNKEYTADNSLLLKTLGGFEFVSYEKGLTAFYGRWKNKPIFCAPRSFNNLEVFVLTYNRAAYLKEQLKSLCVQSADGFKIIVLNNASTDNTVEVVHEIQKRYPKREIELITHDKNIGNPNNFLKSQELASREYCAVFHDDDIIHPDYIKTAMTILINKPSAVVCSCMLEALYCPDGNNWNKMTYHHFVWNKEESTYLSLLICRLNICSVIYKTSAYKKVSFYPTKFGKLHDISFLNDIGLEGDTILLTSVGVRWRQHNGQDSNALSSGPFSHEIINTGLHTKKILNKRFLGDFLIYNLVFFLFEWSRIYNMSLSSCIKEGEKMGLFSKSRVKFFRIRIIHNLLRSIERKARRFYSKKTFDKIWNNPFVIEK